MGRSFGPRPHVEAIINTTPQDTRFAITNRDGVELGEMRLTLSDAKGVLTDLEKAIQIVEHYHASRP